MPLTGALQADFSDFVTEAQKASAALGVMDAEGKKAGATLAKTGQVADGFGANTTGLQDLSKGCAWSTSPRMRSACRWRNRLA